MSEAFTQTVLSRDGVEVTNRFQLATNGVVVMTDAGNQPITITSAGYFNR